MSPSRTAQYEDGQNAVRQKLAAQLGASEDEIAIVRNASEANNIVSNGLPLRAGDEVLLFDQNHPTNNVAWEVRKARHGYTTRRVGIANPPSSVEEVID